MELIYIPLWIIAGLFLAIILWISIQHIHHWIMRKCTLFLMAIVLIKNKNKEIRAIGWATLSIVFWESNSKE